MPPRPRLASSTSHAPPQCPRRPAWRIAGSDNNNPSSDHVLQDGRRPGPPCSRRITSSSRRRLVGALALIVASALALLLLVARSPRSPRYGVVIDAGSTGSRVHVIAYHSAGAALPLIDWARTASMKATPGLSSFASDPGSAGRSLAPLVEFARRRVPPESWAETDVRLMATAGLRLLDAAVAEAVLVSCRVLLRESGFQFQDEWATVISGAEEGMYAWIAAKYALGTLGDGSQDTTGIIELGGASIQVTFVANKPLPPEFSHTLKFGDVTYNLYSHSFLHLGQNVAYESLHDMLSTPGLKSKILTLQGDFHPWMEQLNFLLVFLSQRLSTDLMCMLLLTSLSVH